MVNAAYSVVALNSLDYTQLPSPATVDRRWKRAIKFRGTALRLLTKFFTRMMVRFGNYDFLLYFDLSYYVCLISYKICRQLSYVSKVILRTFFLLIAYKLLHIEMR